jgi:glycine/D-amino acid oxidase-like deaminating enzyme
VAQAFDVVIIGGGVVGASVAFHLVRLGCKRVALLERGELAQGATARSSGIVRTHYSVRPNVALARASLQMFQDFAGLLDDPEASAGLVEAGYVILAPPGPASDAVRASIGAQTEMGIAARLLDRAEAHDVHPWLRLDDIDAIGFEAEAGFADPYLTTMAFASAARRRGVVIRTGTEVTCLLRQGSRVCGVATRHGPISAGIVLSAVNVWSHVAAGWAGITIPMEIRAHHIFSLRAAQPYTANLPVVKDLASPGRIYTRPGSGLITAGSGADGTLTDDPDTFEIAADEDEILDQAAMVAARMPAFAEGQLVRSWSGLYDTTPDWNPVLGPVPGLDGLQVAFGFSGHGFKLSPMVGRLLAQSLLGQAPDQSLHPYRITRFAEGEPLIGSYGVGAVS